MRLSRREVQAQALGASHRLSCRTAKGRSESLGALSLGCSTLPGVRCLNRYEALMEEEEEE